VLPGPIGLLADSIAMAFDPSGRRFACSVGREARAWDIKERRMTRWNLPGGLCDSLAFSGEEHLFLVRQELKGRQGEPTSRFHPGKYPRTVRVYDLLSATPTRPLAEIDDFDWQVHDIEIAPNGSVFAVDGVGTSQGKQQRRFRLYECKSGKQLRDWPTSRRRDVPGWFFFDPTSKILAVSLVDEGELVTLFSLPELEYRGVTRAPMSCLGPDARWSMSVTPDQPPALALYDFATGLSLLRMAQDVQARQLSFNFSSDGCHAIAGRRDGTVSVLDLVEINRQLTKLGLGW
jgi:WD40 repeat protein